MNLKLTITVFLVAISMVGLLVQPTNAEVTYTYEGPNFTDVWDPYTTANKVSVSFTVSDPLPSNLSSENITNSITDYSLADGQQEFTPSTGVTGFFKISTDSDGNIIEWEISLSDGVLGSCGPNNKCIHTDSIYHDYGALDGDGGTWEANGWGHVEHYGNNLPSWINPTPQDLIGDIVSYVINLNLQRGITNSLDAKLYNALSALDDTNENNDIAGCNSLEAFINAVEAQRGKKISNNEADELIAAAQNIISIIGCQKGSRNIIGVEQTEGTFPSVSHTPVL